MYSDNRYETAVYYAANALDRLKPGWHELVDIEKIVMISHDDCILGQSFAAEAKAAKNLSGFEYVEETHFGFYDNHGVAFSNYACKPFWIAEIAKRTGFGA